MLRDSIHLAELKQQNLLKGKIVLVEYILFRYMSAIFGHVFLLYQYYLPG